MEWAENDRRLRAILAKLEARIAAQQAEERQRLERRRRLVRRLLPFLPAAIALRASLSRVLLVVAATGLELEGVSGAATLVCGIGPVEAAAATAHALAARRPRALLHVGLAGARRGCGIGPPALVIGSEAIYCDARSALVRSRVAPDVRLFEGARRALPAAPAAAIGTSAAVGGSHGCDVEAMEGFAVLRAAELAGVPALEVRAVSNEIEEPDRARWRFEDALAALRAALPALVESARAQRV